MAALDFVYLDVNDHGTRQALIKLAGDARNGIAEIRIVRLPANPETSLINKQLEFLPETEAAQPLSPEAAQEILSFLCFLQQNLVPLKTALTELAKPPTP